MEDVAPSGELEKTNWLAGTQTRVRGIGIEASVGQLQQAHVPRFSVAMILSPKQVAIGRPGVDAHEQLVSSLKDLMVSTSAHTAKIATATDCPSWFEDIGGNVVDRIQAGVPVD